LQPICTKTAGFESGRFFMTIFSPGVGSRGELFFLFSLPANPLHISFPFLFRFPKFQFPLFPVRPNGHIGAENNPRNNQPNPKGYFLQESPPL